MTIARESKNNINVFFIARENLWILYQYSIEQTLKKFPETRHFQLDNSQPSRKIIIIFSTLSI